MNKMVRELFGSSEGALIDQLYPLTQGFLDVVAREPGSVWESQDDCIGDLKGWEILAGDSIYSKTFRQFAHDLAQDTIDLAGADRLEAASVEITVVTDPHYNTLLVHKSVRDSYLIADGKLARPLKPNTVRINDHFLMLFQQIIGVTRDEKPALVWSAEETVVAPELAGRRVHVENIADYRA
jgi:predicted Zn-dependent protease